MSSAKVWKTKILKTSKFLLIFLIIAGWIFSGFPQIWQNPKIPPEIKEAKAAAFPNGYTYRRLIDITDAQVSSGPHTNFPMLVATTSLDLRTTANGGDVTDAEGDDIIFTDSDGTTQLAHEVEKYASTTGEFVAWVRVPSLAATSQVYIYYGNSSVTTFQGNVTSNGVTGVWDANFKGVWHLKDLTTSATDDSTSNNNDGAKGAANQPIEADAKIGKGQDFTPTTQYIQVGTTGFSASSGTLETWVRAEAFGTATNATYLFGHTLFPAWSNRIQLYVDDVGGSLDLGLGDSHSRRLNIQVLAVAVWYHVVLTWDGTNYIVYVDSVSRATGTYTGLTSIASLADIGNTGQPTSRIEAWNGIIDEVRISSVARSVGWITTGYNNQNSPSGFYAIGAETTNPAFTQSAYRLFNNLDSTDVGTALAGQDTAATLGSTGAAFRLRMLLHVADQQLDASGQNFKLQFAQQSGTCDTGFVGETYADVTATTTIAYNNNTPADGATLTVNANDPTHGTDATSTQTYEELNNFTNSVSAIASGEDGKWDFALKDNNASSSTAFCFRAVKSDDTVLNTYTVIPQITTAFSTAIEVRAQNYTTAVSTITLPEAAPETTVSQPYNNINGSGSPQAFGGAGTAKPVVTLYNGGASTLTIWYNITTFINGIVSSENYLVNTKGAACADASCITGAVTFDTDTTTGVTIAVGAGNEKDFYLKATLSAVAGKTGTSTLTILGEAL